MGEPPDEGVVLDVDHDEIAGWSALVTPELWVVTAHKPTVGERIKRHGRSWVWVRAGLASDDAEEARRG